MPYVVKNPPAEIKKLPAHAIEIWVAAFNSALKRYKNEGKAHAVAWAAVKTKYKKVGNKWVEKKASEMLAKIVSFIQTDELSFAEGKNTTEIKVIPYGTRTHPVYGKIKTEEKEFEEYIKNFDDNVRKDLPITEGHAVGEEEKPAIGWFKKLVNKGRSGLWAVVEWTEQGKELLKEKSYKYFSPEFYTTGYEDPETHQVYSNILVGGALTNRPYFKEQKEIAVFSEFMLDDKMTIEEIIKKDASDLTDEEKGFLKEHKEDLTDEQKTTYEDVLEEDSGEGEGESENEEGGEGKESKDEEGEEGGEGEGGGDEGEGKEKIEGSEKNVMISGKTLKMLERNAQEGVRAMAELRSTGAKNYTKGLIFSESNKIGPVLPKSQDKIVDFLLSLSEKQQTAFKQIMAELPKSKMFSELGKESGMEVKASEQIQKLAEAKMGKDEKLELRQAMEMVMSENPELAKQTEDE